MKYKRELIGMGFLYMFLLMGLFVVFKQSALDPRNMVLSTVETGFNMDPKDPYVMLQYQIGLIELEKVAANISKLESGRQVYVTFESSGRRPKPYGLFLEKPTGSRPFLKGVVRGVTTDSLVIHYGVESFLIPAEKLEEFYQFPRPFDVRIGVNEDGHGRVAGIVFEDRELTLFPAS